MAAFDAVDYSHPPTSKRAKNRLPSRTRLSPVMAEGVEEVGAERFFATIVLASRA